MADSVEPQAPYQRQAQLLKPSQIVARFVLVLLVAVLYLLVVRWLQTPASPAALQLTSASLITTSDQQQVKSLPHDWITDPVMEEVGAAVYQAQFQFDPLNATPVVEPWAIYLPRAVMNASLAINGQSLGTQGSVTPPITRGWARPLMFVLAADQLLVGDNLLRVELIADTPGTGLLDAIWVGPLSAIEPSYRRAQLARVSLAEMAFAGTLFMALLMAMLWLLRRTDSVYLWYAAGLSVWAVHDLNLLAIEPLLPLTIWRWVVSASLLWLGIFSAMFVLRFLGRRQPRFERFLLGSAIVITLAMPWLPLALFHPTRLPLIESWTLLVAAYPNLLMLKAFVHRHRHEVLVLMCSGGCMMASSLHDWAVVAQLLPRTNGFTIHYSALVVLVAFGYVLLQRFTRALQDAEQLNLTLEQRIDAKTVELENNFALLASTERRTAAIEERQRLLRDMHDGVGGQLVTALAVCESEPADPSQAAAAIQDALDDLRMILDATAPDVSIGAALAGLRQRLEPRLATTGIKLIWQVSGHGPELPPQQRLQVLRIVQEALTNALKHSGGDKVTLRTRQSGTEWEVTVSDNGSTATDWAREGGFGLANMRQRAQALAAELSIGGDQDGTHITLLVANGDICSHKSYNMSRK